MNRAILAIAVVLFARSAFAGDDHRAQALFDEGKRLLHKGDFTKACSKLSESEDLDPGLGTLLYLSECRARLGRYATALSGFRAAESLARSRGDSRESLARLRAAQIEPKVQTLTVIVMKPSPALEIRADGIPLDRTKWGSAIPVDPGPHTIEGLVSERHWEKTIHMDAGQSRATVVVPAIEDPPPKPAIEVRNAPDRAPFFNPQRIAGVTAAATGALALGFGIGLGIAAKSTFDASNELHCKSNNRCDATGVAMRSRALELATGSTVSFVLGGAAIAAGAVIFLTAPNEKKKIALSVGPDGLLLQRNW